MTQHYDWSAYCRKYGLTPKMLKAIALDIGLPLAQLGDRQSKLLVAELEKRFIAPDDEIDQRSLFDD